MQAKIVSTAFSSKPLNAKAVVEFAPETVAEHEQLAQLFNPDCDTAAPILTNQNNIFRAVFILLPKSEETIEPVEQERHRLEDVT